MPNQNASGANQPLNQHPIPGVDLYAVAKDAQLFDGLDIASGDTLLVPPPVSGGARVVDPACLQVGLPGTGTDTATVELYYKDSQSREVLLATATLSPGSLELLDIPGGFVLAPEDEGLFLRVTEESAEGSVYAISSWSDVRNLQREDTTLVYGVFTGVSPDSPAGNVAVAPRIGAEFEANGVYVFNFDDVEHELSMQITDGANTVPLPLVDATVPAGEGQYVEASSPCLLLPPGWELQVSLVGPDPISTQAPVFALPLLLANQGPARQDQGGAY